MCGFVALVGGSDDSLAAVEALTHRGPDASGTWTDRVARVFLGHRRLAIQDLSTEATQPMSSASGRFVLAYNGEVYNFLELRRELEQLGARFRGHSDTEVLLAGIEHWGLSDALCKVRGMFALALWDGQEQKLFLARDRIGQKPLYYGQTGQRWFAASELHALRALEKRPKVSQQALGYCAQLGYIPEPYSIYDGVKKLPPGTILELRVEQGRVVSQGEPHAFWGLMEIVRAARGAGSGEPSTPAEIEAHLRRAIRERLRADVELGALLSGGVDSSLIVALAQQESARPLRTFSVGFDDPEFDESEKAAAVARHIGTEHHQLTADASELLDLVAEMPAVYDEPFGDASQLPTTLVFRQASKHVKVVLTGDGGDELFAGYNRHVWGERVWRAMSRVPLGARRLSAAALGLLSVDGLDRVGSLWQSLSPAAWRVQRPGSKLAKLAKILPATTPQELHWRLASHWSERDGLFSPDFLHRDSFELLDGVSALDHALLFDTLWGLPGDMLVKVDRASMHAGVEARQPFLDHELVEASWRLPREAKLKNGEGKHVLRQMLSENVPKELWHGPKMGFSIPLDTWLRGPLKEWAGELLSQSSLCSVSAFDSQVVRSTWAEHLTGHRDHGDKLWPILMAMQWMASSHGAR